MRINPTRPYRGIGLVKYLKRKDLNRLGVTC